MGSVDVLLGLQWGDEGKGKIVDYLAPQYDMIARFQGGPNAGHTLKFNGTTTVLHTIPSGVFRPDIINFVGGGMVLDPVVFKEEVEALENNGVSIKDNLFISRKAHLILPTHRMLDAASEARKGKDKIGSTLKGIGPAYMDKTGRNGLRVGDIELPSLEKRYSSLLKKHEKLLEFYTYEYDISDYEKEWWEGIELMRSLNLVDGERFINKHLASGKKVLAEGAQGTLLDIDFGTYPYVTSSNTITSSACIGLGIAPQYIKNVIGVAKAYCTRVGNGPFPSELTNQNGEHLRKAGNEFGSTTGRPRRCGWIDLPALRYSIMLNGVTELILTKVDVLNNLSEIGVCAQYQIGDQHLDYMPFDIAHQEIQPLIETIKGWQQEVSDSIPAPLDNYLQYLEQQLDTTITQISIGPERKQILSRSPTVTS